MPDFKKPLTTGHLVLFGLAYMAPIIVLGTFGVLAQITEGHVAGAYVRNAISENMGFLAGRSILLDYLFLPMVIWLIGAVYLSSAVPAVPLFAWLLAFIAVTTAINIVGLNGPHRHHARFRLVGARRAAPAVAALGQQTAGAACGRGPEVTGRAPMVRADGGAATARAPFCGPCRKC